MELHLNFQHPQARLSRPSFEKKIRRILTTLKQNESIMGITLVTDAAISRLNQEYRSKMGPTDVLSFPMEEKNLLGDVVISLDTARRQARSKKWSLADEVLFLSIHGILHLLGYDHMRKKEAHEMKLMEEFLWQQAAK